MTVLHSWVRDRMPLADALAACADLLGDGAVGILMAPSELRIGRPGSAGVEQRNGSPAGLADVYQARAFGSQAELRWSAHDHECGAAVLIAEAEVAPPGWRVLAPLTSLDTVWETALLWGVCTEVADGWSVLRERRVAQFVVPVELETNERAVLESVAYLGVVDGHGNVRVVEERAVGLRPERHGDLQGG